MAAQEATATAAAAAKTYGRGGAGNINSRPSAQVQTSDLQTPTIKSTTFTTGRGGSGNMAKAKETAPEETRLRQDVDTPKAHGKEMEGTYHWGRGGQGNMTTLGKSGAEQARQKSQERKKEKRASKSAADAERPQFKNGGRSGSFGGMVNKGKELLGLKKDRSSPERKVDESAVE